MNWFGRSNVQALGTDPSVPKSLGWVPRGLSPEPQRLSRPNQFIHTFIDRACNNPLMENLNIDLLIIGAGPAGLAAAVEAQRGGISNLLVVEKGLSHSQMIRTYYKEGKRVDAQYAGVEALCMGILCLRDGDREGYLALMDYVIESSRIPIRYNTEIWSLASAPGADAFEVKTTDGVRYMARFVIIAIGKMGRPRQPDYFRDIPAVLKNQSGSFSTSMPVHLMATRSLWSAEEIAPRNMRKC